MKKIIRNRIMCYHCGNIIESKHVHDFRTCQCERVGVDGGHDYLKRIGNQNDYQELSLEIPEWLYFYINDSNGCPPILTNIEDGIEAEDIAKIIEHRMVFG